MLDSHAGRVGCRSIKTGRQMDQLHQLTPVQFNEEHDAWSVTCFAAAGKWASWLSGESASSVSCRLVSHHVAPPLQVDARSNPSTAGLVPDPVPNPPGPGRVNNTVDYWFDTTSFWACMAPCAVPTNAATSCCTGTAMGGLSLRLTNQFPPANQMPFHAEQVIALLL